MLRRQKKLRLSNKKLNKLPQALCFHEDLTVILFGMNAHDVAWIVNRSECWKDCLCGI